MVDSIGGAGNAQNVLQARNNQTQKSGEKSSGSNTSSTPADEVNLSEEAISLSEANTLIAQTRALLEEDQTATLSNGNEVDQLL